ncbi:hypothetical protein AD929_12345 [Gluconobacter potus]|uniref:Uncharacterized protein n=1 Tax=Gluconobacter potus TaxID=2724927 RepID=A0A149QRV0_9PROT|nr:hypothetical protein [Gluconobacter potus]KXV00020.1 hypothetical protein AD929_12345 [Gluconobacter potus]
MDFITFAGKLVSVGCIAYALGSTAYLLWSAYNRRRARGVVVEDLKSSFLRRHAAGMGDEPLKVTVKPRPTGTRPTGTSPRGR